MSSSLKSQSFLLLTVASFVLVNEWVGKKLFCVCSLSFQHLHFLKSSTQNEGVEWESWIEIRCCGETSVEEMNEHCPWLKLVPRRAVGFMIFDKISSATPSCSERWRHRGMGLHRKYLFACFPSFRCISLKLFKAKN